MNKIKAGDEIICIDNTMLSASLTRFKKYTVKVCDDNSVVLENNSIFSFNKSRFVTLQEYRILKIKSLYE